MVRTYPVATPHFDPARIAAWSAAIALHLLALLLLLIPATYQAVQAPRDRTDVRLIPLVVPPTPPPEPIPVDPEPKVVPVQQQRTVPVPTTLPPPTATLEDAPAIMLPAADPAPMQAPTDIGPATPSVGVQLNYRSAPPPSYPISAIRAGEQGTVMLRVEVDSSGQPVAVSIERSSGSRALDQAARSQVLKHWRFVPAQRDGVAVPAIGMVPISFNLPQ